jgi:hypothetical protein
LSPQRPESEIDADIQKYGDFIPALNATDKMDEKQRVWQFSDMFMLSAFLHSQNVSQTNLLYNAEAMKYLVALENPQR